MPFERSPARVVAKAGCGIYARLMLAMCVAALGCREPASTSSIAPATQSAVAAALISTTLAASDQPPASLSQAAPGEAAAAEAAPSTSPAPADSQPATSPSDATAHTAAQTRPAAELNLLAMGDWGEGASAQKLVADSMADYTTRQPTPCAGLLSAGDNFYVPLSGVNDPVWQALFEKMYDPTRMSFPFYIALGNHDYDQKKYVVELAYAKANPRSRWKLPSRWYRLDLPAEAPLVTVIMLDSDHDYLSPAEWSAQRRFLADELQKPRAPWTVCCAHHPLFSNGAAADNGILQSDWGNLFRKMKVDLYVCGHEHNLQHLEIPGWQTSFVIAGGGGAHIHPMIRGDRGPFSRAINGFSSLRFTPDSVTVTFCDAGEKPVHVFERRRTGAVKTVLTTPSDPGIDRPLEAIQGLYDKIHHAPAATQGATQPASKTRPAAASQPASP